MKTIRRYLQMSLLSLVALLLFGTFHPVFSDTEGYVFVNSRDDVNRFEFIVRLKGAASFSERELVDKGLPTSDDEFLVITLRNLAAYVEGGKSWKKRTRVDLKDPSIKVVFDRLITAPRSQALQQAFEAVNDSLSERRSKVELTKLVNKSTERFSDFLSESHGRKVLDERIENSKEGGSKYKEFIVLDTYYRFDRSVIKDLIIPPEIAEDIDLPEVALLRFDIPPSDKTTHVAVFTNQRVAVPGDIKDRAAARLAAARDAIEEFKRIAIQQAVEQAFYELGRVKDNEFDRIVEQASTNFQYYVTEIKWFEKPQIINKGLEPESLQLNAYFKIDKSAIKELIVPLEVSTDIDLSAITAVRLIVPASVDSIYVVSFKDLLVPVPDNVKDRHLAYRRAAESAVDELKKSAFQKTAEKIKHELGQQANAAEFDLAVQEASKNHSLYVMDFKWFKQPQVISRGREPESLRLSVYFKFDKEKLKEALIEERGITAVDKYDTYVEIFWNVPDKDIHPDVIEVVLANIEDLLRQFGYEVIEFENIKGKLIELLKTQGGDADNLYSENELERFKANLDLRNIDQKFENGKRILADYADLLFGVTINTIDVRDNELTVRLTLNATLFEGNDWFALGSSDQSRTVPHTGGTDNLIEVAKYVVRKLVLDLEPRVRSGLALRMDRREGRAERERDFLLVFPEVDNKQFRAIMRSLRKSENWSVFDANMDDKIVYISHKGNILDLTFLVEDYLDEAGLSAGFGDHGGSDGRIEFSNE